MESTIALTWLGIAFCVAQSGAFSGRNLALFGISALRLESEGAAGNDDATRLLELRRDSNFLLTTVLWGNVGTNVRCWREPGPSSSRPSSSRLAARSFRRRTSRGTRCEWPR